MAVVEGHNIEDLKNGVVFLNENVYKSLRDLIMYAALFDKTNVGFLFGKEIEDGTIYLTEFMTPKDLIIYGRRKSEEDAVTVEDKMYLGLKTKIAKNTTQKFILCSINTHTPFDDASSLKSSYRNHRALMEAVKGWNRIYPASCVALLISIDFTSGKDTLDFYWCDGTNIYRFPEVNLLKPDGEVLPIMTGSGIHK